MPIECVFAATDGHCGNPDMVLRAIATPSCPLLTVRRQLPDTKPMTEYLNNSKEAGERLARGEIVAFPTETVYGLGGDARNPAVIQRIFQAKGRPSNNPLIVHVASIKDCSLACSHLPSIALSLMNRFAPGPITVVVPKRKEICSEVTAGLETVGIRIPSAAEAIEVLSVAAIPIAAPSANLSGKPSCTTWQAVREDLDGRIDAVLCSADATVGLESTVVDCLGDAPIILRPGSITLEQIRELYPDASNSVATPGSTDQVGRELEETHFSVPVPASPGTMHPHYQPKASVVLFVSVDELNAIHEQTPLSKLAVLGVELPALRHAFFSRSFASLREYASGFYESLREADRRHADLIAIQLAPEEDIGFALRDRQRRAAGET